MAPSTVSEDSELPSDATACSVTAPPVPPFRVRLSPAPLMPPPIEAFAATGAIATKGTADPWSPKALRASAGSALRLPLLRGLAVSVVLAQLRISGAKIVAASAKQPGPSDADLLSECLAGPAAIFVGSEGAGLPAEVEHAADARIAIPMSEQVESLNAGVAASIVLYETAKLRGQ